MYFFGLLLCVSQCEEQISQSLAAAQALADDVDIHVLIFRDFGKDKVKRCRISPDSFLQIALQLAYYRVRPAPY